MIKVDKVALWAALGSMLTMGMGAAAEGKKGGEQPVSGKSFYDFTVKDIGGKEVKLSKYKGEVLLVVNVASK